MSEKIKLVAKQQLSFFVNVKVSSGKEKSDNKLIVFEKKVLIRN